jgi:hypothetical protein
MKCGKICAGLVLAAVGAAVVVGSVGCQEYATYPEVKSARGMSPDLNNPGSEAAMVAALQYVATRYPPGGPKFEPKTPKEAGQLKADYALAINLPKGMRKSFYERMAKEVGDQVLPLTADVLTDPTVPVYYVTRVWMRFHESTIDVLRPMPEMGPGPDGKPVYQCVTVRLTGGLEPWRVIHARAAGVGEEAPEPYFLPDIERTNQYAFSQMSPEEQANYQQTSNATVITAPQVQWRPKVVQSADPTQASAPEGEQSH